MITRDICSTCNDKTHLIISLILNETYNSFDGLLTVAFTHEHEHRAVSSEHI